MLVYDRGCSLTIVNEEDFDLALSQIDIKCMLTYESKLNDIQLIIYKLSN